MGSRRPTQSPFGTVCRLEVKGPLLLLIFWAPVGVRLSAGVEDPVWPRPQKTRPRGFFDTISYLLSPISYLLSPISYLLSPISYLLSPISYLLSPISYLLG